MRSSSELESDDATDDRELRRYLLGHLDEDARCRVESRLLSDGDYFELAEAVEDEVVEEYVDGRLSGGEKQSFEKRLRHSAKLNQRLLLHRALRRHARRSVFERWLSALTSWFTPALRPAPALAAVLIVFCGGAWGIYRIGQLQTQLVATTASIHQAVSARDSIAAMWNDERLRNQALQRSIEKSDAELARLTKQTAVASIASFILTGATARGSSRTTRLQLPSGQPLVELRLDIGIDDYRRYTAVLRDAQGRDLMTQTIPSTQKTADTAYAIMPLPAALVPPGDYTIELRGVRAEGASERIDSYTFRIDR